MSAPPSSPQIFSSSFLLLALSIVHRIPCFTYLDEKNRENSHPFGRSFQNFLILSNRPIVSPVPPHSFKFRPAPARRRPFKRHGYHKVPTPIFSRMYAIMDYLFSGGRSPMKKCLFLCLALLLIPVLALCEPRAVLFTATDLHYIAPTLTDNGDSKELKNFGKNGRMGVNFRDFFRLGK